jgi:diaminobutyrate-2-oxoglutarate transaminase
MRTFERLESEVRSYCRTFPAVFSTARGSRMTAEDGREYLDFWSGAGALNYGHNNPRLKCALLDYLERDGITHSLDLASVAKRELLECFERVILMPRGLRYKVQFPGPTGTNAVEAALKLARKVTGRPNVVYFTRAYHGMTLGALAVTANAAKRAAAGVPLGCAQAMPYEGFAAGQDSIAGLRAYLDDSGSGLDLPAAAIVETVQAEGGVHAASADWLRRLGELLAAHGVLLIVDDIQVGCGRTGTFFSFEEAGIRPDIVCLSKSISGFGLPLSLVLIRPELDRWRPGEHNGTFRGHNLAFVTAAAALAIYWQDDALERAVRAKAARVEERLLAIAAQCSPLGGLGAPLAPSGRVRGRGLIQGLDLSGGPAARGGISAAQRVSQLAFERGLIVETAGSRNDVVKLLPALTIEDAELEAGLEILQSSVERMVEERAPAAAAMPAATTGAAARPMRS